MELFWRDHALTGHPCHVGVSAMQVRRRCGVRLHVSESKLAVIRCLPLTAQDIEDTFTTDPNETPVHITKWCASRAEQHLARGVALDLLQHPHSSQTLLFENSL